MVQNYFNSNPQCLKQTQKVSFHNISCEAWHYYFHLSIWIFAPKIYIMIWIYLFNFTRKIAKKIFVKDNWIFTPKINITIWIYLFNFTRKIAKFFFVKENWIFAPKIKSEIMKIREIWENTKVLFHFNFTTKIAKKYWKLNFRANSNGPQNIAKNS